MSEPTTTTTAETAPAAAARDYGPVQLAQRLGLPTWTFTAARERGLIPEPDLAAGGRRRWSAALADTLAGKASEIVEVVGTEPPIGANRAAGRLAARTGLAVERADVETLAARGTLRIAGHYERWPLYDPRELDAIDVQVLAGVVAERQAWIAASLDRRAAAERLGWRLREFDQVTAERGITPGPLGRYPGSQVEALAADWELACRLDVERLIGPDQAAERLEVRRLDWDYLVAMSVVAPRKTIFMPVGRTGRREVAVPLYRAGDVDQLRELPWVDWEAVRACRPGEPSPLRCFARRPPTRAQVVRRFVAELGDRYGVEVWACYHGGADRWELDWDLTDADEPTLAQVQALVAADLQVAQYHDDLVLTTQSGAATRWARAMLAPGAAVVLDTETTDLPGAVCELAVVDAASGEVLLDTLVNPAVPISPEAQWVHGLTDADVADAPPWPEVLPLLLEVTRDRNVLAYNAEFDYGVIAADTARYGLDLGHLADNSRWGCVMNRRSDWARLRRWLPLGGGHRALGDAQDALQVLRTMAERPLPTPRRRN
jgi:hypothetical protein